MPLISDDGLLSACPPAETHKFYFCPDMEPDECWLFKQWDTRKDKGARVCFHSAVHDPFHDMALRASAGWKVASAATL